VVLPQLLLCGLFGPRETMARPLQLLSDVLPMTYAVAGMQRVATSTEPGRALVVDVVVVVGSICLALALGAATLRRRSP